MSSKRVGFGLRPITIVLLLIVVSKIALAEENRLPTATVDAPFIEMHTGPGRGYPVFYVAERGETVEILMQRTDWYKVRHARGKEGWVYVDEMALTLDYRGEPLDLNLANFESFKNRQWEAGFMAGDFGGTDAISVYGGYHMTRNLSAEVEYTESFGNTSDGRALSLSLVHQPFPNWRYSPFFTIGGGVRETSPKSNLVSTEERSDNTANVGVGIRIYLLRRVMLRLQYKNHAVLTDRDDDEEVEEWKIGISAFY